MANRVLVSAAVALTVAAWGDGSLLPSPARAEQKAGAEEKAPAGEKIDYRTQVKPILSEYCYECHGTDEKKRESELRLDLKEVAFADLGGHRAIVPGDPEESELYLRISAEIAEDRMPPYDAGTELTAEQIETLRKWIEQGAEWSDDE
jgi:mono/diheme cytochrome c family protein